MSRKKNFTLKVSSLLISAASRSISYRFLISCRCFISLSWAERPGWWGSAGLIAGLWSCIVLNTDPKFVPFGVSGTGVDLSGTSGVKIDDGFINCCRFGWISVWSDKRRFGVEFNIIGVCWADIIVVGTCWTDGVDCRRMTRDPLLLLSDVLTVWRRNCWITGCITGVSVPFGPNWYTWVPPALRIWLLWIICILLLPETDNIFGLCAMLEVVAPADPPALVVGTKVKIVGAGEADTDWMDGLRLGRALTRGFFALIGVGVAPTGRGWIGFWLITWVSILKKKYVRMIEEFKYRCCEAFLTPHFCHIKICFRQKRLTNTDGLNN